jgi:hypothetical protein
VNPVTQGRAAAFREIERLLDSPADDVLKAFQMAAKESK